MYKQEFEKEIAYCASEFNIKGKLKASYSSFEDFNYQSSILFSLAKHPEKDVITSKVIEHLTNTGNYEKIEITGNGFISVKVKVKNFIESFTGEKKKVVIDYCGANVAKKMHIGHIRSMFIGDFIARLKTFQGNEVIRFNHIGDWGNQFGFLLEYIYQEGITVTTNKELTNIYKLATQKNEQDLAFKKDAEARAVALQKEDPETVALWKKCCAISLSEMQNTFQEFNLLMNENDAKGESFYAKFCPEVESLLLASGVAIQESDGSVIVPADSPKQSPLVIKKSTGAYLYAMYDLAAIYYRITQLNPDEIIYVVDKRQDLHFKQVFNAAEKMGWGDNCQFTHIGFGTILGKDKKPLKTRSGESLYLDDLIVDGFNMLNEQAPIQKIINQDYKNLVLKDTLFGALKFYDLHFSLNTDYVFDWDSVLSIKGNSAPYLQNAIVRMDSIFFSKFGVEYPSVKQLSLNVSLLEKEAKTLFFETQKLQEVLMSLEIENSPLLTEVAMSVCRSFHSFYECNQVIGSANESLYFALLAQVMESLKLVANVLGIQVFPSIKKFELISA